MSVKTAVALPPNLTLCTGFFIVSGALGGVVPDWAAGTCSLPGGLYFISFFKLGWTFFILITNKVRPQLPNEAAAPLWG